jgi:uncharacterized protein (TIGR03437 family)
LNATGPLVLNLSSGSGTLSIDDCQVFLRDQLVETTRVNQSSIQATFDPTQILPNGHGYITVRSKTTGTRGEQSMLVATVPSVRSFTWSRQERQIYAILTKLFEPHGLVRMDPLNKRIIARSAPLNHPSLVMLNEPGNLAWVVTEEGASVTPISLPSLATLPSIAMPAGTAVRRLWAHPTESQCFVADITGRITVYCSGKALDKSLVAVDEIEDVLFEKSGESWAYSRRLQRLFRLRLGSDGLSTDGEGIPIPVSSRFRARIFGGFGRLYCSDHIVNKGNMSVRAIPFSTAILGVDEATGIIYAGATHRGRFGIATDVTTLYATRDPDVREVNDLSNGDRKHPFIFLPAAELNSFLPMGDGRYGYLGSGDRSDELYAFQLMGLDRALIAGQEGVVNAASFEGGAVSPGMIVSIYGTGIGPSEAVTVPPPYLRSANTTIWNESSVMFGQVPAPILFASNGQINVVVPDFVSSSGFVDMRVFFGTFASAPIRLSVARKRPAFFTSTSIGGAAVGVFPNGEIAGNGRRAKAGDIISLFGTGFGGPSDFRMLDGDVVKIPMEMPRNSIQISICGKPAEISYAGLAPGFMFGLFQFNVKVPLCEPITSGRATLTVSADGISGPANVFLPVE